MTLTSSLRDRVAWPGGGHWLSGSGTAGDAIVAGLQPMTGVQVDPERRTARVLMPGTGG